ncbi:hypothetical protein M878_30555 [Streptomyces roseochromogenus subsp. oscitans DS 12.976]|uniref:Uncharacterized protein n=1 Tax=Streptomyces roseochromogenus subsp. oscitans DS 12.976 TaxID=1352936 RepID=V6JX47_STRRC|nr:hypothetical protein M878_30555 [Streptomyces roseochromogenus subsp. oscitans DS 12.976]
MICARCAHAADQQLGRDEHCDAQPSPGTPCDCQHRTERYQQTAIVITRGGRRRLELIQP